MTVRAACRCQAALRSRCGNQVTSIWFDEGSHLHVPKTLVQFGVYADRSSEGYRYFGPSTGVGPTVMLPIAGSFAVLGIGLWQARLVVALYLMGCAVVFYVVARRLGGLWYAWIATVLFVTSRGAPAIEYGRQVLGEVPALFFLLCGTGLWFAAMSRLSTSGLVVAGLLFGLAAVTKQQVLIVLVPAHEVHVRVPRLTCSCSVSCLMGMLRK